MPRRTDSRARMIHAASELFRQRGYHATTFSDVVRESGAPRPVSSLGSPGKDRSCTASSKRWMPSASSA